jgi:hypothetical protein
VYKSVPAASALVYAYVRTHYLKSIEEIAEVQTVMVPKSLVIRPKSVAKQHDHLHHGLRNTSTINAGL